MAKYRRGRINDAVKEALAVAIGEVREPMVINNFVSITRAEVAPDLKYAKVHLSVYADSDEKKKEAFDTVVRSRSFIRNKMKDSVRIRLMPELHFVIDNSCDYGMHIDKILSTMVIPPAEESDEN
mgnify:CR=1 FL=1